VRVRRDQTTARIAARGVATGMNLAVWSNDGSIVRVLSALHGACVADRVSALIGAGGGLLCSCGSCDSECGTNCKGCVFQG